MLVGPHCSAPVSPLAYVRLGSRLSLPQTSSLSSMATSTTKAARKQQTVQHSRTASQEAKSSDGDHVLKSKSLPHQERSASHTFSSSSASDDTFSSVPRAIHRFNHNRSILTITLTEDIIFAGTEGGEILVYSLSNYEIQRTVKAHDGSVLGFCIVPEQNLLFSSAGDRFVNVWDTRTLKHIASIYSAYDVGDIFCVSYSRKLQTVYLGSQNTSIQWFDLKTLATQSPPDLSSHPYVRTDRFFDSAGPTGIATPRRDTPDQKIQHIRTSRARQINKNHIHQFAHYGYVYCTLIRKDVRFGAGDQELLISGGGDGTIKLWTLDEANQGKINEYAVLDDKLEGGQSVLTIVLDGTFLYSGRVDGDINVWDLETKQMLRTFRAHRVDVLTLAVGDGFLYSADVDGTSKKFDHKHECLSEWKTHDGMTLASNYVNHNGRALYITGGNDDAVAVWNMAANPKTKTNPIKTDRERLIQSLREFVSYPTVSSDPRYKADCRRAASFLRSTFKGLGAATDMIKTDHNYNPIVHAQFTANSREASKDRKRILFYGHYDVVAAVNRDQEWLTDPFTLEGRDGYVYGRGVSDNKGPILAAAYAVAEVQSQQRLDVDVVFLIEGEEESGSRGFQDAIRRHKGMIGKIDWILFANSYWLDDEVPCLTYGLRGVIHANVEILSPEPDLHSGVDGSKLLDEPLKDLVMVLSRLSGRQGKIKVPGFYDSIPPLTKDEMKLYDEISKTLVEKNPDLGNTEDLTNSLLQRWRNPTLTVHGFSTSSSESSTIIPRKATAAISIRIVPNQVVDEIANMLTRFLLDEFADLESQNAIQVNISHKAEPWLGDYNNALFKTLERAVMEVWSSQASRARRRSSINAPSGITPRSRPNRPTSGHGKSLVATSSTLANNTFAVMPAEYFSEAENDSASPTSPYIKAIGTSAQRRPLYIREGGSIPAIRFLEEVFDAAAAQLPCGQASDNAHLDNERFRITNLWNAKEIFTRVFLWLSET